MELAGREGDVRCITAHEHGVETAVRTMKEWKDPVSSCCEGFAEDGTWDMRPEVQAAGDRSWAVRFRCACGKT